MNRSLALSVITLCLVAAAAWWILLADDGGAPSAPVDTGASSTAPLSSPATTDADPTDDRQRQRVEPANQTGARSAAELPRIKIRIIDESEQPVDGAEVAWFVLRQGDDFVPGEDRERVAFEQAVVISNQHGLAHIPFEQALGWSVFARDDRRFGETFVIAAEAEQTHTLTLKQDFTIRAQVVGPSGLPVGGVRVGLTDEAEVEKFSMSAFRETVDPDGIATFRHAQRMLRPDWGSDGAVMLGCPTGRPVFERVDFDAISSEPYLLRLPGTGSIHIELVDADAEPIRGLTERVYARLFELPQNTQRRFRLPFDGAQLDLDHVGLGLSFRLELSSPEVSGGLEFDGPSDLGERIEQRLVVTRNPTLSGRLLNEEGVPQSGYWHAVHVQPQRGYYNQYFETKADGLFHTAIPDLPGEPEVRGVIFRRTIADLKQQAFVDLAKIGLRDGRNELGDIALSAPPILVSGHVVDGAGKPVSGATMRVLQGDPDRSTWPIGGLTDLNTASEDDGTFVVRAHHIGSGLLLHGAHNGNSGPMVPFLAGTHGLRYALPAVGSASMRLTFDGDLTASDVLFCHTNAATGATKSVVDHYAVEGDIAHWRALRPGRYDFTIRTLGSAEPIVAVRGIEIRGGENSELPAQRLGDNVRALTIRVVDEQDRPVDPAHLVIDPRRRGDQPRAALATKRGERQLLVPESPIDLMVIAPGYRTQIVRGVARDITVTMSRGHLVELRVKLPKGFPPSDQQLHPRIQSYDRTNPNPQPWAAGHNLYLRGAARTWYPQQHSWLWNPQVQLDRNGRASFRVPAAGEYAVEWSLRGETSRDLSERARRLFSVSETTTTTRVEFELTSADVR